MFRYVRDHAKELVLPDQDILNAVYGRRILEVDDSMWNYDARNYNNYLLRSAGVCDMDWVMKNTSILHFCGRSKPWQKGYIRRFGILYKHYEAITERIAGACRRSYSPGNIFPMMILSICRSSFSSFSCLSSICWKRTPTMPQA